VNADVALHLHVSLTFSPFGNMLALHYYYCALPTLFFDNCYKTALCASLSRSLVLSRCRSLALSHSRVLTFSRRHARLRARAFSTLIANCWHCQAMQVGTSSAVPWPLCVCAGTLCECIADPGEEICSGFPFLEVGIDWLDLEAGNSVQTERVLALR